MGYLVLHNLQRTSATNVKKTDFLIIFRFKSKSLILKLDCLDFKQNRCIEKFHEKRIIFSLKLEILPELELDTLFVSPACRLSDSAGWL